MNICVYMLAKVTLIHDRILELWQVTGILLALLCREPSYKYVAVTEILCHVEHG